MALIFGALADDLTGGMELAAMLVARNVRCELVTDPDTPIDTANLDAIVMALKTRVCEPANAAALFERGVARLVTAGARQIFFKYCATFDSTDRGNIGPCADVLRKHTSAPLTLFCPAFPEIARRVFQGHLFADDMLISESPKRLDPLTPMLDPSLVRTLQRQTQAVVGLLPEQVVRGGQQSMADHVALLIDSGVRYAIADASTPEDLASIAELTVEWPLMTGGSSVAEYYPALWRARGWVSPSQEQLMLPSVGGYGAVLSGSCSERALEQLRAFESQRPVHWLDLDAAFNGVDVVAQALAWAEPLLRDGPVAISATSRPADVVRMQARLGRVGAGAFVEKLIGRLAAELLQIGVRRFVVSGGETSGSVMDHLGLKSLQVGPYGGPGVARAIGSNASGPIALCLKSGRLGPTDLFHRMLSEMTHDEPSAADKSPSTPKGTVNESR